MASMDALVAFTHMKDNLPAWITRVSELAAHTHTKHNEYSAAYRRHANFKPRRRKHSSVCSIHTDDLVPIAQRKEPSPEPPAAVTPSDTPDAGQRSGRKRPSDEAPSVESNEEYAFVSTRHNVIIEYDGHTQKTLEAIVRDIGVARNNMRRAKMAMMPRTGIRAGILNRGPNLDMPSTASTQASSPLSCIRSTRTAPGVVGVSGSTVLRKESPFDYADKQLELAHSLCETAAYQVLRSGDCGTELDGVEEKFKMLLEAAINEVDRIMAEKKQQEDLEAQQADGTAKDAPPKPPPTPSAARLARVAAIASSKPSTTTADAIEVDDNSSLSAESIDLSAFRSSRIRV
ncbi:hypothetical protein N7499_009361 [Penicillium canescens]|uniref:Uncharacterized protein n=1 Tax=Penicillium canescens TaxID=5083 RepID=A0AAD6NE59_PENCN|nr:uncharacterized protein N7446_008613 [Penicillium canescens]KAJ6019673.1 hypothetical protein N7522_001740 [Penicillium canescens]KAJ6033091.1 hypothetical protein N7444_010862 [Penicillium canescens]KAJ6057718.1 hypothetical protein N7460_000992 [Penicillium canescens]KAJ6059030.1 hypothetical protein N7446_008613 [Penicillium canescens]KAJ6071347.1 hypothetical protein N7499_009361 [Penicillium canescens]